MQAADHRRRDKLFLALFLLLPAVLLADCIFGGRHYLPFDIAEFPPLGDALTAEQRQALRATANYDATEAPIWFRTELQLARAALAEGQLPFWNGYVRGGAPMLPHGHMGLLNPLHWPALLFADPDDGLLCLTYTMLALAGSLMFGLLRAAGLGSLAAAFGGLAFAWSGTMTANGHWFMRLEPLAMLPGLLWAMLTIARRSGRDRYLPTLGLSVAMAAVWMSGFPQYGIPVTMLAGGFGTVLVLWSLRSGFADALTLTGWLLLGSGLGLLLAMPQLLPMLEFYPLSNRPIDESLDRASRHAWSAAGFLGYLFPNLFSHPGDITLPQDAAPLPWLLWDQIHWETGERLLPNYNFTEYALFPGTAPLLLAVVACCGRGPSWRWLPVAGLAVVWTLASGAFGSHLAYTLPGIKSVPPYRFAGPACALVAMLAALGLEQLRAGASPWLLRTLAVVLTAGAGFCLAESTREVAATTPNDPWLTEIVDRYRDAYAKAKNVPPAAVTPAAALQLQFTTRDREDPAVIHDALALGKQRMHANFARTGWCLLGAAAALFVLSLRRIGLSTWMGVAAIAATSLELFAFGHPINRGQPMPHPHDGPVHAFLRERRDAQPDGGGFLIARGVGRAGPWNLPGGTLATERIRDLNFYTFVDKWSDLPIRKLYGDAQILRGFVCDALPDDVRLRLPLWDLLGLRFVLSTQPMQHAGEAVLSLPGEGTPAARPYFVYERKTALPRAWFVGAIEPIAEPSALVERLIDPKLDPRAYALVDAQEAPPPLEGASPRASERTVRFVADGPSELRLEVGAGAPGYLVLADTQFPGWTAECNGYPIHAFRANLSQRLLALDGTAATIVFRYRPLGWTGGLWLGGLGAASLLALLTLALRRPSRD